MPPHWPFAAHDTRAHDRNAFGCSDESYGGAATPSAAVVWQGGLPQRAGSPSEDQDSALLTDEEVMAVAEEKPNKITTTTASILLGLIAGVSSQKLMMASTMAAMATPAAAQPVGGNNADDGDHGGHLTLYFTLFLTVVFAIITEKFISGYFKKAPAGHLIVPKEEQIRTPVPKRLREGDDGDWAEPVDEMEVDEIGGRAMSPKTARMFYDRAKAMHEDYVKLAEEKLQQKDDEVWQAYNNMEYYKGQIEEEQERTRNMATNRDVFRQDMKMWHDRFDEKAEEYAELETKHQDMSQKYQEMSDLYNEAVRMKQETDGMMKRADRDKEKAVDDFRDMKIRWQTQLGENRKLEAEKNEWKKKYEELAAEQAAKDQAAQRNKVDPQEYAQMEKKLKEGMKMNMSDLEALNLKLQRDNEAYHKANRELSERLALARAPAEIQVARHGTLKVFARQTSVARRGKSRAFMAPLMATPKNMFHSMLKDVQRRARVGLPSGARAGHPLTADEATPRETQDALAGAIMEGCSVELRETQTGLPSTSASGRQRVTPAAKAPAARLKQQLQQLISSRPIVVPKVSRSSAPEPLLGCGLIGSAVKVDPKNGSRTQGPSAAN
eukprot:s878_g4.t1